MDLAGELARFEAEVFESIQEPGAGPANGLPPPPMRPSGKPPVLPPPPPRAPGAVRPPGPPPAPAARPPGPPPPPAPSPATARPAGFPPPPAVTQRASLSAPSTAAPPVQSSPAAPVRPAGPPPALVPRPAGAPPPPVTATTTYDYSSQPSTSQAPYTAAQATAYSHDNTSSYAQANYDSTYAQAGYYSSGTYYTDTSQQAAASTATIAGGINLFDKDALRESILAEPKDSKKKKKEKKEGATMRIAGGEVWYDDTLDSWPPNDFRIFVGNLGPEVTDEVLAKAFQKYPSYAKSKVIKDKKLQKSKGYGFVSLTDAVEGAQAIRQMNGTYIGNRPCKLKKSSHETRTAPEQYGKRKAMLMNPLERITVKRMR